MTELHQLTGISQNTLSLFANHKNVGVQYATLNRIVKALDINLADLIEFTNEIYSIEVSIVNKSKHTNSLLYFDNKIILTNIENTKDVFYLDISFKVLLFLDSVKEKDIDYLLIETQGTLDSMNTSRAKLSKNLLLKFDGKTPDLITTFRYVVAEAIVSDLKNDYNFFITSKIVVNFKNLLPSFYFGSNYEKDKVDLKTLQNSSNIVHTDQAKLINLIPKDPNLEFEVTEEITDVIPDIDSLDKLSNIYSVDIDKDTYKRSVKVILEDD